MKVFAQARDARIDLLAWDQHAQRFFQTRIGLTEVKTYEGDAPAVDSARVILVGNDGEKGARNVSARPSTAADVDDAKIAEERSKAWGLSMLAARCGMVWIIEEEGDDDRIALRLAAILAGVLLGPIVTRDGAIFGVKTARERLASSRAPG